MEYLKRRLEQLDNTQLLNLLKIVDEKEKDSKTLNESFELLNTIRMINRQIFKLGGNNARK